MRWLGEAGSLPTRDDLAEVPEYAEWEESLPEVGKFVENLELARVRPTTAKYPDISQAMGKAVASVLQGESAPADALREAAEKSNAELAVP